MKKLDNHMLEKLCGITFILLTFTFLIIYNLHKPRVFVLYSYGTGSIWDQNVDSSLMKVLQNNSFEIKKFYLNTDTHPQMDYMINEGKAARKIIEQWRPRVLIAVGDNAQMLVGKYYANDPDMAIVFAGVQGVLDEYGYDTAKNVTGIFQKTPLDALKQTFLQLYPKGNARVELLSDNSESAILSAGDIIGYNWQPLRLVSVPRCWTFPQWQQEVKEAPDKADILFITHYSSLWRSLSDHTVVPPREVIQWTLANSRLPAVGDTASFVQDGGGLALQASPYELGEVAGQLTLDIVKKGIKPVKIFYRDNQFYVVDVRAGVFSKYHIKIPSMIESFARATGRYYP